MCIRDRDAPLGFDAQARGMPRRGVGDPHASADGRGYPLALSALPCGSEGDPARRQQPDDMAGSAARAA
eukprot:14765276-Alexandrium_andersonii.AAC.1